ncbi:glycerophosphodiester phosphodiesterase [Agaribacter marinus]|uniref:Glycerophosphoryl diester phosphodiesterase n=1 Tax=Agaribacter marinus TaxID=1431249 RepID=A0AA37T272_9ALTE|nr:glycerophosphodiester phosphodiesterase [Agaribacter marinus]GLR72524.1 glycerophosphoryl diester phosphodiesterase [Agaribacter marinus]
MRIVAHRGFSEKFPENTIIAFKEAIAAGVSAIECDVQEVDDEFYVFHDWSLDRLTNEQGSIKRLNSEQLSDIRVQDLHKIPTVSDVFSAVNGKVLLNLELKSIDNPLAFIRRLNSLMNEFETELVLSSFDHPTLINVRSLLRDSRCQHKIRYAGLISHLPITKAQYAVDLELDIAAIDAHLVNGAFVKHAHQHNIEVWSYTVNEEVLLRELDVMKVDAIFSDKVSWALDLLGK